MEVLFENCYTMSKMRLDEWAKRPIKKNNISFMWLGVMVFAFFMLVYYILNKNIVFSVLFMLLMAFSIYRYFFKAKIVLTKQFKILSSIQGKEEWERVIQFTNSINVTNGNAKMTYQWSQINEFIDDKDYFILVFKNDVGIRLDKNGFTKGTADSFLDFVKREYQSIPFSTR